MAKVDPSSVLASLSGKLGDNLVIRRRKDGTVIVAVMPDFSNRVFSEEQRAHQSRFQQAVAYARVASKTNPMYARLAADTIKSAYNFALGDWFHPPVIHQVHRREQTITIHATDDVQVTKVVVTIANEHGETLEQGPAVQNGDSIWEYRTTTRGNILVEAFDLAGNVTRG